jgi:hypothetical protein
MKLNLHASALVRAAAWLLLFWASPAGAQTTCPLSAATALERAWRAYRSDSLPLAVTQFLTAHRLCPGNQDAEIGLGFAMLRSNQPSVADSIFRGVLGRTHGNSDAWEGRARTALRLGDTAAAVAAGRKALSLAPKNADLRRMLDHMAPEWERVAKASRPRPSSLQLVSRIRGQRFEISRASGWESFYVQGVNLGVALPGRYPTEFPTDSARYAGWLDTLASMHANTIRVYTILPPVFYRALRGWNTAHPDRALWLIHGVWTELPPHHDFENAAWKGELQSEMRRVVDVVHGTARIAPLRGHAAGRYDADVSRWTLAYIVGREWEPFAVKAFDAGRPRGSYRGKFLEVRSGASMDVWMAAQCDYMLAYEADTHNALRPIAYTNWPPLDPLRHPTEATTKEEAHWRRQSGRGAESKRLEYENDAIGLDANLIEPTTANPAGWFAAYHAYPYYPDFIMLDPHYRAARSGEGISSYFGYLQELIRHHQGMPTLIAEYGVPSSRGIAHLEPQGWHHGGHDERRMAAVDVRLTREIQEAGAAGGVIFAWLDEWFKKNWIVVEYEIPADNTRRWHNVMDAEQNYGVIAVSAGDPASKPRLGGDPTPWRALRSVQVSVDSLQDGPRRIRMGSDESYYYIAIDLPAGGFDWGSKGLQIALDTYLPRIGQHRLQGLAIQSEIGFEFLVDLQSPESAYLSVIPEYNRHSRIDSVTGDDRGRFSRRPVVTRDRMDGRFEHLHVITNRARFGRDGSFFPAQSYDRGRLRFGTEMQSTNSDWYLDSQAGLLQIRIPWDLLNVTDPSTRTLLFDKRTTGDFGTVAAEDWHAGVIVYAKGAEPKPFEALPEITEGVWREHSFNAWRWKNWTEPRYHSRLKPVFDSLKALWAAPPSRAPARPLRPAP